MDILGLRTCDMSVMAILSLRLTSTLSRVLYLCQIGLVIMTAIGSVTAAEVESSELEHVLFSYVCLSLVTAAFTFIPLMSRGYSVVRRSGMTEDRLADSKEAWMHLLLYVSATMIVAVMSWGLSISSARMYKSGTVPSRIARMDVVGLFQFTAMSQLLMGFRVVWPRSWGRMPIVSHDDVEEVPLVRRDTYEGGRPKRRL